MPTPLTRVKIALVVKLQRKKLLGYAMKVCRNRTDAEDLIQESVKNMLEAMDGIRATDEASILSYLFMSMRNNFLTRCRKQLHEVLGDGPRLVEEELEDPGIEMERWRLVDDDILREAAEQLSDLERQAYTLRGEGLSYEAIAGVLHLKPGTVGKLLFNARGKMGQACRELLRRKLRH
jgi:RNA polymerase sigma-70 factor, ECF subfamily